MEVPSTFRPQLARPRSAYIHIPFCRHRCGYCNFALVANRDYLIEDYLNALDQEIQWLDERYELDTLSLGGGTPSHLSPKQIERLFVSIRSRFQFDNAEVSIEANPSDLADRQKVSAFADQGVNRFSLGVQSFSDGKLKQLERDHDAKIVSQAAENILAVTPNLSFDLIFSVMEESLSRWKNDLKSAITLTPKHISTYELTIEKGTQFWNREAAGKLSQLDEDLRAEMYDSAISILQDQGFCQYEISSFAQKGFRCRHNEVYWSGEPYFAFGPGASRFVDGVRETNHGSVTNYIRKIQASESPVQSTEKLEPFEAALERLVIGLRHRDGVAYHSFESATSFSIADLIAHCREQLVSANLIESTTKYISLTLQGMMVYDSIAELILACPSITPK